ncbi:hypothetical protein SPI_04989 [Niveomyces insectorum RCEF 264]|uniref:Uncharacterized protein n=1 Tax=Niveomyces insectorum RCEF 264 TaxID=1081102 RepID=A0A167TUN9_9HYPO|nr:hypothetical protein SPI_04989 [Niveomyces insectorum RCEF 264]
METIQCICRHCQVPLGRFINLWTQIGKSYYSPLVAPDACLQVGVHGTPRVGEKATLVEGCHLQDIACQKCKTVVGIECLAAPINHVLDKGQILLRKTVIRAIHGTNGSPVELVVKRFLDLRGSRRTSGGPESAHSNGHPSRYAADDSASAASGVVDDDDDLADMQAQIETQRVDIERIDRAGYEIVAAMDAAVQRIGGEVTGLQEALNRVRRDLGDNRAETSALQADLRAVKDLMHTNDKANKSGAKSTTALVDRLCAQAQAAGETLATVKGDLSTTAAQLRKELAALKTEFQRVKRELAATKKSTAETASRSTVENGRQAQEMAKLRATVTDMRRQLQKDQQERAAAASATAAAAAAKRSGSAAQGPLAFGARELDIFTSNLAKIGSRASQVETLQMELALLKGRVQRLESQPHDEDDVEPQAACPDHVGSTDDETEPRARLVAGQKRRLQEPPWPAKGGAKAPTLPVLPGVRRRHSSAASKDLFYGETESLFKRPMFSIAGREVNEHDHSEEPETDTRPSIPSPARQKNKRNLRRRPRKTG